MTCLPIRGGYDWNRAAEECGAGSFNREKPAGPDRTRRQYPGRSRRSEGCHPPAADRLAEALSDVDEEELVAEFKQMRRRGKATTR